mgnify:CR=1 FL=1
MCRDTTIGKEDAMKGPEGYRVRLDPQDECGHAPKGEELLTRITEGMTEYTCNGLTGYALSEYPDQIVGGRSVSVAA